MKEARNVATPPPAISAAARKPANRASRPRSAMARLTTRGRNDQVPSVAITPNPTNAESARASSTRVTGHTISSAVDPSGSRGSRVKTIDLFRHRPRDISILKISEHTLAQSLPRVTAAAAVGGHDTDYVVALQGQL